MFVGYSWSQIRIEEVEFIKKSVLMQEICTPLFVAKLQTYNYFLKKKIVAYNKHIAKKKISHT